MTKTTYNDYLVDTINHFLETYTCGDKREELLKDMILEINSTNDNEKLNNIAEQLDYLINIIKMNS